MTPPETRYARSGNVRIAYQAAGSGLRFADRGMRELKGLPEPLHLYRVLAAA